MKVLRGGNDATLPAKFDCNLSLTSVRILFVILSRQLLSSAMSGRREELLAVEAFTLA